jgi:hypothetical protein
MANEAGALTRQQLQSEVKAFVRRRIRGEEGLFMMRRHKAFADIPAFYTDSETGFLIVNDLGEPAADEDVAREAGDELDRLALEMCAYDRAQGKTLEPWQLEAEAEALRRQWQSKKEASK